MISYIAGQVIGLMFGWAVLAVMFQFATRLILKFWLGFRRALRAALAPVSIFVMSDSISVLFEIDKGPAATITFLLTGLAGTVAAARLIGDERGQPVGGADGCMIFVLAGFLFIGFVLLLLLPLRFLT